MTGLAPVILILGALACLLLALALWVICLLYTSPSPRDS